MELEYQFSKKMSGQIHGLVAWRVSSRYSLALTSVSLKDFPFLHETTGGSLNISLSNGWF